MTNIPGKLFAALALTALAATIAIGLLSLFGPDWSRFASATCTETRCFCEMPRTGALLLQPANSLSSLGFVFIGFLMILMARSRDWNSALPPLSANMLGVAAIIVGTGSVLLHATLTLWGQFFDVLGMYLVSGFFLVSALAKWRSIPDRRAMIYYGLLCAVLVAILYALPEVRRWLFAVILLAAIVLELVFARPLRLQVRTGYYVAGLVANIVAFTIWNLDQRGQLCAPDSLLQGHAIWHLLGAVALWFVFLYYRSERPVR
ncbi:ceramidase domain-containing protein [uncultured Parasphingorhabdus sp.]|uniref:ceramidase domain-containing protein n=1 Tax=uncultured Parasphingorhabdus sp. TaxID=2709694 RepID=UPI0030D8BC50|tara:strand:+ start:34739 stop:35521 length:783 start_codon:yes stop_codon:yes gene_type:complete